MQSCPGQTSWRNEDTPWNKPQSDQTSIHCEIFPLQLAAYEKVSLKAVSCHFKGEPLAGHDVRSAKFPPAPRHPPPFSFLFFFFSLIGFLLIWKPCCSAMTVLWFHFRIEIIPPFLKKGVLEWQKMPNTWLTALIWKNKNELPPKFGIRRCKLVI